MRFSNVAGISLMQLKLRAFQKLIAFYEDGVFLQKIHRVTLWYLFSGKITVFRDIILN